MTAEWKILLATRTLIAAGYFYDIQFYSLSKVFTITITAYLPGPQQNTVGVVFSGKVQQKSLTKTRRDLVSNGGRNRSSRL